MDVLSVISVVTGVIGIAVGIYFGRKALRLEDKIRRFDWDDVENGLQSLSKNLADFRPDLVLTVSGPGSIVSNLLAARASLDVPIYSAVSRRLDGSSATCVPMYRLKFTTSKWEVYVPDEVFRFREARILICDDCVLSGDTLFGALDVLTKTGFRRENILTMALFVTELALKSNKGPDVFWFRCADSEFYMPWGKSYGRGY